MRTEKLSGEEREDVLELFWEEVAAKTFTDRSDERSRISQGLKTRSMMRTVWEELEQGYAPSEIIDRAEGEAIRLMAGRPQTVAETSASLHRRLARLSIEAVRPFAVLPQKTEAA
jgi:hypothetical protein